MIEIDDPSHWAHVLHDGIVYAVSPRHLRIGITIGEAATLAEQNGCTLPTPELALAIHHAADCRLPAERLVWKHNGTIAQMSTPAVVERQVARIEGLIDEWKVEHRKVPALIDGEAKTVVRHTDGRLGIYGWFRSDGRPIQPFFAGHSVHWGDASQGLRLCKRVAIAPELAA